MQRNYQFKLTTRNGKIGEEISNYFKGHGFVRSSEEAGKQFFTKRATIKNLFVLDPLTGSQVIVIRKGNEIYSYVLSNTYVGARKTEKAWNRFFLQLQETLEEQEK
jgi:hypothetical protein